MLQKESPHWAGFMGKGMTEDQMYRIAITAASVPIWAWLIKKAEAHLRTQRDKHGRGLPERIGRRLGGLWSRCYRAR